VKCNTELRFIVVSRSARPLGFFSLISQNLFVSFEERNIQLTDSPTTHLVYTGFSCQHSQNLKKMRQKTVSSFVVYFYLTLLAMTVKIFSVF
jgi:hypothetical protein